MARNGWANGQRGMVLVLNRRCLREKPWKNMEIDGCMANFGELENSEDTFWESVFLLDFRPTTELVVSHGATGHTAP